MGVVFFLSLHDFLFRYVAFAALVLLSILAICTHATGIAPQQLAIQCNCSFISQISLYVAAVAVGHSTTHWGLPVYRFVLDWTHIAQSALRSSPTTAVCVDCVFIHVYFLYCFLSMNIFFDVHWCVRRRTNCHQSPVSMNFSSKPKWVFSVWLSYFPSGMAPAIHVSMTHLMQSVKLTVWRMYMRWCIW